MNNQYQCFGKDLTTDCAQKLIQELFKGQTIRRREIVSAAFEQHHERGGTNSGVRPNVIHSALKGMKESGLAVNPKHGVWHITYYIKTLNEFIEWASQFDSGENTKQYLFRGVSSADYRIDASAYRRIKKGRNGEDQQDGDFEKFLQINKDLIREARYRGHDRKNGRKLKDLEVLAEFQHYGAATFLMDFSYNALVALWFACKESSKDSSKDGKVVAVPPNDPKFIGRTEEFSVITLDSLGKKIDQLSLDNKKLYQWQPRTQNERIIAQQSIFLFGVLEIEINPDEECIIDGSSKKKIRESLKRIYGVTEDMLFPDFDGFARQYSQNVPYPEHTAAQYKQRADEAIKRGEYTAAIADYGMMIYLNPNDVDAYYERGLANNNLGVTNNNLKQYETAENYFNAAIADFEKAININSNDVRFYYNRGLTNNNLEKYDAAIADFDEVIRQNPDYVDAHYNRGLTNNNLEKYDAAIADFDEVIRQNPNGADAYYNRGLARFHWGQSEEDSAATVGYDEAHLDPDYEFKEYLELYEASIGDYNEAIRLNPEYADAYHKRGLTKLKLKQYESTIVDFDMFISRRPDDADAYYERGLAKSHLGLFNEAQIDLQMASQLAEQSDNVDLMKRIDDLVYEIDSRTVGDIKNE